MLLESKRDACGDRMDRQKNEQHVRVDGPLGRPTRRGFAVTMSVSTVEDHAIDKQKKANAYCRQQRSQRVVDDLFQLMNPLGQQVNETDPEEDSTGEGVAKREESPAYLAAGRKEGNGAADHRYRDDPKTGEQLDL